MKISPKALIKKYVVQVLGVTIASIIWTSNMFLNTFTIVVVILLCLYLIFTYTYSKIKKTKTSKPKHDLNILILLFVCLVLIGATGWLYSPFFFALYFITVIIYRCFDKLVAILFITTLILFFIPYIGKVDVTLDIITITSLLLTIPFSIYIEKK